MPSRYGLQIRSALAADAAGIAGLMASAGRPVPAPVLEARLEALRREPGVVLLAVEWGPPGGIVAARWSRTFEADAPVAQLTTLLVGPDDRRRGIGRLLLKAVSQAARSAGCASLLCPLAEGDEASRAFCRVNGFEEAGSLAVRPLRKRAEAAGPRP